MFCSRRCAAYTWYVGFSRPKWGAPIARRRYHETLNPYTEILAKPAGKNCNVFNAHSCRLFPYK